MPELKPLRVIINAIPHEKQRYNTIGDWQFIEDAQGEVLIIRVSRMPVISPYENTRASTIPGWKQEALVAIHELIEALLCKARGIKEDEVDAFDKSEQADECDEPGDHPLAPYRRQHCFATGIERQLAYAFQIPWHEYEENILKLSEEWDDNNRNKQG